MGDSLQRRTFLATLAAAGSTLALPAAGEPPAAAVPGPIRVGMVGVDDPGTHPL